MVANKSVAPPTCANCGSNLADRYCAHCGQDAHVGLSIGHFVGEFFEGVFHFDSTFWRTFLPLLFKPGFLTEKYLDGKRKSYAPPVRSYLVLSLVYFVVTSLTSTPQSDDFISAGQPFATGDCTEVAAHAGWMLRVVPDVKGACERAARDHGHALNNAVHGALPKVMFVVLPLVALVQYWLNRRQRSWYVENLIFVLHFQSFYFLAGALALLLVGCLEALWSAIGWSNQGLEGWFELFLYVWSAYYLFVANRRVYRTRVFKAGVSVVTIAMAYTIFLGIGVAIASVYEFSLA